MAKTTIGVLIFLLVMQLGISLIAPHLGISGTSTGPETVTIDQNDVPSAWDAIGWVWNSLKFAFEMTFYQIPGMPVFINAIWTLMNLLTIICIVFLARGGG